MLLTMAAHVRGLQGEFLEWDDTTHVTQNPAIRALTPENLRTMFTDYSAKLYIPFTFLSFAVDYQVWGRNPYGYHLTNLLLQLANTLLVLALAYRLLRDRIGQPVTVALLTAAIFGVHPLRVESVAWVTERKDVLFAFFLLLSLLAYLTWTKTGKRSAYWACLVLFIASALSKSAAVTLPVVLLIVDYFRANRVAVREKIPFFAVSVIMGAATFVAQAAGSGQTVAPPEVIPLWARAGLVGYCSLFYVGKFFWPFHLSALYPTFEEMEWTPIFAAGWLLAFLAVFVAAFTLRRRAPLLWPCWLFYLITLSPTIGLVPVGVHVVADRFSYVPLIGLVLPVSAGVVLLAEKWRGARIAVAAVVVALLAGLAGLSAKRSAVWTNTETLFQNALAENPDCYPALVNLTVYYTGRQQLDDAIAYGTRAVEIAPNGLVGRKNLARAYIVAGRHGDAIKTLRPAVEHGVDDPAVWRALAECFEAEGDRENAEAARARLRRFEGEK